MRIGNRIFLFRRRRWRSRRKRSWMGSSWMASSRTGSGWTGSGVQRKRRRFSRRKIWLLLIVLLIIAVVQMIVYVERRMEEPLVQLAKVRVKQIATESLNEAITEQVAKGQQYGDLIDWKTDSSGKITGFMLNYKSHMEITSETVQTVRQTLERVSKLNERIPLGQALGSPILASFGPRIPIRIEPQSDVKVDLNTRRQDAGINMILVEVYLHIKTEVSVIVPFNMGPQAVETEIPVSYLLVVGDVPMYYYDNKGNPVGENGASAPNIALPSRVQTPGTSSENGGAGSAGDKTPSSNTP
ncbi:sporulation protein YunB [Paenibacillus caui]|uniref:sporulation protein YunB n=1 Tax=Paenibacillus caui TaxID=2873927 RepID=UPI001EFFC548|nr:sporulation protein YunB [Paenibacillus caui]